LEEKKRYKKKFICLNATFGMEKNKIKERKIESENCPICADTDN
jgi:hypothetical protein